MKTTNRTIIILVLLSCFCMLAQTISPIQKTKIIADLDSVNSTKCTDAIEAVLDFNIIEALPKIENIFWKADIGDKPLFLLALRKFKSIRAYEYAKGYLDSLKSYLGIDTTDIYIDKSYAITILFENNDFTYSDYVLSLLCCNESKYRTALPLLYYIINYDEKNAQRALDLLISTVQNAELPTVRGLALFYYDLIKGKNALPILIDSFMKEKDSGIRRRLMDPYFLKKYTSPEIEKALRAQIKLEDDSVNKTLLSMILLKNYNNPINYKIISDLASIEMDLDTRISLKSHLDNYIARRPIVILDLQSTIDSLINYTDQIYNYNWMGEELYKNQLHSYLQTARNYLIAQDSVNCYKQIKLYQNSIQQVYSDSAGSYPKYVSKDAYKFLYYYPKYILERLPSPPTVKLEDSQGKLLRGGSLQYYEGSWKNAIDNGDGTFMLDTKLKTIRLRMIYEYLSLDKTQFSGISPTVTFTTVQSKVVVNNNKNQSLNNLLRMFIGA